MVQNKRGMSAIVTTLIIILLVIVSVTMIWYVVKNVLTKGSGQIGLGAKCLNTEVVATKVLCTETGTCNVTYTRKSGDDEIGGIKLLFTNDLGEKNFPYEINGSMNTLDVKTKKNINTGISNCSKVNIAVYYLDASGDKQLCSEGPAFKF